MGWSFPCPSSLSCWSSLPLCLALAFCSRVHSFVRDYSFWLRWPSLLPGSHTNTSAKLVRPTAHSGISPTARWIVSPSSRSRVSPAFRESAFSCFFLPVARPLFSVGAEIGRSAALSPSLSALSLSSYFFLANGGCAQILLLNPSRSHC